MASRKRSSMGKIADEAACKTDKALEERELEVLLDTSVDWDMLRPKVTDTATFDKLRKVVEESASKSTRSKNKVDPSHLTVFLDLVEFEPDLTYFMKFDSDSGTDHFMFVPDSFIKDIKGKALTDIIAADQTTQIEVVLGREPGSKLFLFHRGDDPFLHVKWNRDGDVVDLRIKPE